MIIFGNPTENGDWIIGDDGDDWIYGAGGNDFLQGGGGSDLLLGNEGDDTFVPGLGVDFVYGGFLNGDSGNDTVSYAFYGGAVLVNLDQGYGYQQSLGNADKDTLRGIENIGGSADNDWLGGDAGANKIYGNDGDDYISGGGGNDSLYGGKGTDFFPGSEGADLIDGGTGNDKVDYSTSNAGVAVNLTTGLGFYGTAQGDVLIGIENLQGSRYGDSLFGNAQANTIRGLGGNDRIFGYDGNDYLHGYEGTDTLFGGGNNDVLIGGEGKDTLTGGGGADQFIFLQLGSDPTSVNMDTSRVLSEADIITDFSHAEGDKIDLSSIGQHLDANNGLVDDLKLTFIGQSGFSGTAGELLFMQASGAGETRILGDIDGDGGVDFRIVLNGIHELTAGDFVL